MKNKSTLRQIVMLLIFIVLLLIVINPALLPFISAEKAAAIRATLADTFGFFKSEAGGFSLPTLFSCLAIIFGICALSQLLRLILEHTVRRSRSGASPATSAKSASTSAMGGAICSAAQALSSLAR